MVDRMRAHPHEAAALCILDALHGAEGYLVGRHIMTFNNEVGIVRELRLDNERGLRFTLDPKPIAGPDTRRFFPVSTIRNQR